MRRLAAVTLGAVLLLAGCADGVSTSPGSSPSGSGSAQPSASAASVGEDQAKLAGVVVTGKVGSKPSITFSKPFTVTNPVGRVITPGTGEVLAKGQVVEFNYLGVNGADGSALGDTYSTEPDVFVLGDASLGEAISDTLIGQRVGTRVLFAVADSSTGATNVLTMDVTSAKMLPTRASGTAVAPTSGLPTVTLAKDGEPSIKPATATKPTKLVVTPLIKGSGPAIANGQTITVKYSGWLWDGTAFDSSWKTGTTFTTAIGAGGVIKGWDTGLIGKTVGSQILLVVPPDLGYGTTANGPIPANSTLVFVVDILNTH